LAQGEGTRNTPGKEGRIDFLVLPGENTDSDLRFGAQQTPGDRSVLPIENINEAGNVGPALDLFYRPGENPWVTSEDRPLAAFF
jgi:hypothetical protein